MNANQLGHGFPFALTVLQPPSEGQGAPPEIPPARVRLALDYLRYVAHKQQPFGVVNGISIEIVPGVQPSTAEAVAREEAARALGDYFAGRLRRDGWERDRAKGAAAPVSPAGALAGGPGCYVHCPRCAGRANPGCQLCEGSGEVYIFPAVRQQRS